MKKIALMVAVGAFGTLASACGSPARTDAGVDTGSTIIIPDAPSTRDAFRRVDAFVPLPEGACGSVVQEAGLFAPLPAGCLPRCSGSTTSRLLACVAASPMMTCADAACDACYDAGVAADTSPVGRAYAGDSAAGTPTFVEISCGGTPDGMAGNVFGCETWQQFSCITDSCPAEFGAALMCYQANPMTGETACASQLTALRSCQMADQTALSACVQSRARACFQAPSGFAPGREISIRLMSDSALLQRAARFSRLSGN